jgi:maltose alpha-D-glucosyltransferase/alpha-amylase
MKALQSILEKIYPNKSKYIFDKLSDVIKVDSEINESSKSMWYKNFNLYVTYPDAFKIDNENNLHTLNTKIDYIKSLGFNAIHILPFLKSPLIDFGFDIDDYYNVRDFLGGNGALDSLVLKANQLDMKVFMDIVFNHISDNHEWFKKAQLGDEYYRNFFIYSKEKPHHIKTFKDDFGVWARYNMEGIERDIRIIFPEQVGEVPHWVQGKDGYWYFHMFYPHQIDLNWLNPDVFIEMAKVLIYWAQKGINSRLDVILFVGKEIEKGIFESTENTHDIIKALHQILKRVSLESTFLVEVFQPIDLTLKYFGQKDLIESELGYNFHLMNSLWASLIIKDEKYIWDGLETQKVIPDWSQWVTFLRNHDELSLEFTPDDLRETINSTLLENGMQFREGFGISGRTYSLLGKNPKRTLMSYFLLASLPGNPALIYGDELGQENDDENMKVQRENKISRTGDQNIEYDTRDINRGVVRELDFETERAKTMIPEIRKIFTTRLKYKAMYSTVPEKIDNGDSEIFGCRYNFEGEKILVYVNLSEKSKTIEVSRDHKEVMAINDSGYSDGKINLGGFGAIWISL